MIKYNRAYHKDFLNNCLPKQCAKLVILDPPYYRTKGEFDFIWPSFEAYLQDVRKWAIECKRILSNNGTLFVYGSAKYIAYIQVIFDEYFKLENNIVWEVIDRQTKQGMFNFNCFAPVTERILMYSNDDINMNISVHEIRDYIREQICSSKGSVVLKDVNQALGTATSGGGIASACLSLKKEEVAMITEDAYAKLQSWCSPYLTKPYSELRDQYEQNIRYFNNEFGLTDVMRFSQEAHNTGKYDHDTVKPDKLTRSLIMSTSRPGDLVVVPMAGSGTECEMSALEGRPFIAYDIKEEYVDMTNDRVQSSLKQSTLDL